MNLRHLRRRCQRLLAESGLRVPDPFDIHTLCRDFGEHRGRPIHLLPGVIPEGSSGVWAATDTADYIGYRCDTSPVHQTHLILHEIGHIICRHETAPVMNGATTHLLLPTLDPAMVNRILQRTNYTRIEEKEAETIASLILERISHQAHEPARTISGPAAEIIARIEHSLTGAATPSSRDAYPTCGNSGLIP